VSPEHQAAGRIAVEAMRQMRRARQPEAKRGEIILQTFAPLGSFVHRQPLRLIDYEHQTIAIEHACGHLFRRHDELAITGTV
jgi:hypothetical protein